MYELSVRNHKGERLDFTGNRDYDILKIDGLDPPPARMNFSTLANFDGSRYNSGQLDSRNLVLEIYPHGNVEENRIKLYKFFPLKSIVRIFYSNDSRSVYIDGYVESFEFDAFTHGEVIQVSIICGDPYWKSDEPVELSFSSVEELFEFPFSIPAEGIEFSRIDPNVTAVIENGEVETGIILEFRANANGVKNPVFINRTSQERFALDFEMRRGDVVRVNTRRGEKSVTLLRYGQEINLINHIRRDSKWVRLLPGLNELSYECEEGQSLTTVCVSMRRLYEGV